MTNHPANERALGVRGRKLHFREQRIPNDEPADVTNTHKKNPDENMELFDELCRMWSLDFVPWFSILSSQESILFTSGLREKKTLLYSKHANNILKNVYVGGAPRKRKLL